MPFPVTAAAALAGRLLLAAIFLHEAWSKLTGYSAALAYMQAFGVPGQLLPLAIAVELGCAVLILCGESNQHPACLQRQVCTLVAYRFLYAPRTGGAYDSHHRTAGSTGRTQRRSGR